MHPQTILVSMPSSCAIFCRNRTLKRRSSRQKSSNRIQAGTPTDEDEDHDLEEQGPERDSEVSNTLPTVAAEEAEEEGEEELVTLVEVPDPQWISLYSGQANKHEARSLEPATLYRFRVCAHNSAGMSEWSGSSEVRITEVIFPKTRK